jgi:hypothetical protein
MSKIKEDVLKLRAEARAARYLALKQYQLDQRKHQKMDNVTMFVLGIAVAVVVAIGTQLYILGAL